MNEVAPFDFPYQKGEIGIKRTMRYFPMEVTPPEGFIGTIYCRWASDHSQVFTKKAIFQNGYWFCPDLHGIGFVAEMLCWSPIYPFPQEFLNVPGNAPG